MIFDEVRVETAAGGLQRSTRSPAGPIPAGARSCAASPDPNAGAPMTDPILAPLPVSRGRPALARAVLLAALAAVLASGALAGLASPAHAKVTIGIGQQTPDLFGAPLWRALHAPA